MYVIIICINGISVHLEPQALYQPVELHHCWTQGACSYWHEVYLNKAKCMSLLVSSYVNITRNKFIHISTSSLLWWWYDDEITCWIFICLQKYLNVMDATFCLCLKQFSLEAHIL